MKRVLIGTGLGLCVVVLLAVVAASQGLLPRPGGDSSRLPPCDQLPVLAEVQEALETRATFAAELRAVGDDVTVSTVQPCADKDRAAIEITYSSSEQLTEIERLLQTRDGFGVPVQVTRS